MIFTTDDDLNLIRATLSDYLPENMNDWRIFHIEAGRKFLNDLEIKWFRRIRKQKYELVEITDDTIAFDPDLLFAGWDYQSDSGTVTVSQGDKIYCMASHTEGGIKDHIYQYLTDGSEELSLFTTDFSDVSIWEDITDNLNDTYRDVSSYYTLFLIYRFLVNDQSETGVFEEQRDYFLDEYYKELNRLLGEQGILYDWDEDGILDEIEELEMAEKKIRLVVRW